MGQLSACSASRAHMFSRDIHSILPPCRAPHPAPMGLCRVIPALGRQARGSIESHSASWACPEAGAVSRSSSGPRAFSKAAVHARGSWRGQLPLPSTQPLSYFEHIHAGLTSMSVNSPLGEGLIWGPCPGIPTPSLESCHPSATLEQSQCFGRASRCLV